jgi:hypothetical protein
MRKNTAMIHTLQQLQFLTLLKTTCGEVQHPPSAPSLAEQLKQRTAVVRKMKPELLAETAMSSYSETQDKGLQPTSIAAQGGQLQPHYRAAHGVPTESWHIVSSLHPFCQRTTDTKYRAESERPDIAEECKRTNNAHGGKRDNELRRQGKYLERHSLQ